MYLIQAHSTTIYSFRQFHFLDICSIRSGNASPWGLAFLNLETTRLNFLNLSKIGVMGGASILVKRHELINDFLSLNTRCQVDTCTRWHCTSFPINSLMWAVRWWPNLLKILVECSTKRRLLNQPLQEDIYYALKAYHLKVYKIKCQQNSYHIRKCWLSEK